MEQKLLQNYVKDLCLLLHERLVEPVDSESAFQQGRRLALAEALDVVVTQAMAFGVDEEDLAPWNRDAAVLLAVPAALKESER